MPNENGYGYSDDHTPQKQRNFKYILGLLIPIYNGVISRGKNCERVLYYIDLNSGPGTSLESFVIGSPIVFLESAQQIGIEYRAILIEHDPTYCEQLQRSITGYNGVTIYCDDHRKVIKQIIETTTHNRMGLLYADPNGDPRHEFSVIRELTSQPQYNRFDVLIHFSATAIKRARTERCLYDYLEGVNKKYGFLSRPQGQWQWTFLCATNWKDMPLPSEEFVRIGTPEAMDLLEYLNNPKTANGQVKRQKKRANGYQQMTLPIEPMPNTYVTPVLEK
jgi:hypothetical protein